MLWIHVRRLTPASLCATLLAALWVGLSAQSAIPVVPGAAGFGMTTRAAYGNSSNPTVIHVTKLTDDGTTGTLRSAMEASGNRVVIFDVSGTITLNGDIIVSNPYLTVAGQTAPSPGIAVTNYGIQIPTHDVLLQHFRVRHGGDTCGNNLEAWQAYNIVFDHMSVSWDQDENIVTTNYTVPVNLTLWRSIIAEGLIDSQNFNCGGSPDGTFQSHGLLIYQGAHNVAVLQNLFASNVERNPYAQGDTTSYIANNLIYNFGDGRAFILADPGGVGPASATFVGNYLKRGPMTANYPQPPYVAASRYLTSGSQLYLNDNFVNGTISLFNVIGGDGIDPNVGSPPVTLSGYTPMAGSSVYATLLPIVGARPLDRDAADARIIAYVQAGTGPSTAVTHQSVVGGYPTLATNTRVLTPPANPNTVTGSGYTNLEIWLQGYATALETSASVPTINTTSLPDPVLTVAYSRTLTAINGTAPYAWAITAGALPTGLTIGSGTGTISGTPTVAGVYTFTVRATDNAAVTAFAPFTVTARAAVTITTAATLPVGQTLSAYSFSFQATGDTVPYVWAIVAGTPPNGLTLNTSTGVLSGTPTTLGGPINFSVRATGALGSTTTLVSNLTIGNEYRPANRPYSRNAAEGILFRRATAPTNPASAVMRGDLWMDTSTSPPTLKVCTSASATTAVWVVQ